MKESNATTQLFMMAANDEEQLNSLLAYYRSKIAEFDKERLEWLTKIEELRIQYDDKHRTEWELHKRKEEISDLQRTLSEHKLMLFEERQLCLKLQRENDMLKIKEMEDRKKIQELLSSHTEEQIVLQKDIRPQTTQKFGQSTPSSDFNVKGAKSIIKTVYVPNEQMNSVAIENESLKRQLDEAHHLMHQQLAALKEEYDNIKEDCRMRLNADQVQIKQLSEKAQKLEKHNIEANRDFYQARQKYIEKERTLQEEMDVVRQRNSTLINKIQDLEKKSTTDNKATMSLMEKKSQEYQKKLKNDALKKEENLQILKEQYASVQQIYIQKIRTLEENLSKLSEKYQNLERRRNLEIEGFKNDIKRLNQRLKEVDNKKMTERYDENDMEKFNQEAARLKEETIRQIGKTYGSGSDKKTKKRSISRPKTTKKGKKPSPQKRLDSQQSQNDDLQYIQEEDNQSSLALDELEQIQRQIDDLERRMDASKRS